ncbi:MAG: rRNA maturation RNase YbeY [Clostridia bacterium]
MVDIQISNLDERGILNIEDVEKLENFAKDICKEIGIKNKTISIVITDSDVVSKLNKQYRDVDSTTDVLSFPLNELESHEKVLGEIVIDLDRAKLQSDEYNNSILRELSFLIMHGILHLIGYDHDKDHRGDMREKEKSLEHFLLK